MGAMGHMVGSLMEKAKDALSKKAQSLGCNAILGMNFNVSNDSSGEHGHFKNVILTMMGTPCVITARSSQPQAPAMPAPLPAPSMMPGVMPGHHPGHRHGHRHGGA